MTSYSERISILAAPEIQDLYSIPKLNAQEQEYFFTLTDEELAIVNRLNTTRNRIHLILTLGYFRIKRVCLIYQWHEIADDYLHVAQRYYPKASKRNKNLNRQTGFFYRNNENGHGSNEGNKLQFINQLISAPLSSNLLHG